MANKDDNSIPFWSKVQIRRFDCPKGLAIKSFAIRELTVADDKEIEQNVALFWKSSKSEEASPRAMMYESVRKALVEVDGVALDSATPYTKMDTWTQKTMLFVIRAYSLVNGMGEEDGDYSEEQVKSFLERGAAVTFDRLGP